MSVVHSPRPSHALRIGLGGQLLAFVQAVLLIQATIVPAPLRLAVGVLWLLSAASLVAATLPDAGPRRPGRAR